MKEPHIVIIGGGAGGLELATQLGNSLGRRKKAKITLVDTHLTHIWKPLLHEIAAGTLYVQDVELSYIGHASQHYFHFQLGALQSVNRAGKEITIAPVLDQEGNVIIAKRIVNYDYLVIAVGSLSNDFGAKGVKEHCFFLDNPLQAETFHTIFLCKWLNLISEQSSKKTIDIVIIGGGATGVELAAELRGMIQSIIKYGAPANFDDSKSVNITLLEAAQRVLPVLPEALSEKVAKALRKMNIAVHLQESVVRVEKHGVLTQSDLFFPADMTVWAAGIMAPEFLQHLDGLETNRRHQLIVKPTLQTTNDENIFALGDCAACPIDEKTWVPPRAQAAHQQAVMLAKSLTGYLRGKPLLKFHYRDYGSLVSISNHAVGNLMRILERDWLIEGKLAKWIYLSLYQKHLLALHGIWRTSLQTLANVFGRKIKPKLKLH